MAAGNFTAQNKVRAGAYINFKSSAKPVGNASERGIMTIPMVMKFGEVKKAIKVNSETDILKTFGYDINSPELLLLKEAMKRAATVIVYRINGGVKATKTDSSLTVTAKYEGSLGNKITVKILEDADNAGSFNVTTFVDGVSMDVQTASTIEELETNSFVLFSGTGELVEHAGIVLTGGTDSEASVQDYSDYFRAIEVLEFNTIALPVEDNTIKSAAVSFAKRMRDEEGKKIQLVIADMPTADYEGVISVKNGVVLNDGTVIDKVKATAYVAGMTAGAAANVSNTYSGYDSSVDVDERYTNSQIVEAIRKGEFVFIEKDGKAVVEQDINTFISVTPEKGKEFSKNRVLRVLDGIGNDIKNIFEKSYIGKVNNNADGRNLFKAEVIKYIESLQNIGAVQNFDSGADVEINASDAIESITVNLSVQPVDSIEKLYMTVTVK